MKPSSPKPSEESIGEDRPLAFSINNILHHVSISLKYSYECSTLKNDKFRQNEQLENLIHL